MIGDATSVRTGSQVLGRPFRRMNTLRRDSTHKPTHRTSLCTAVISGCVQVEPVVEDRSMLADATSVRTGSQVLGRTFRRMNTLRQDRFSLCTAMESGCVQVEPVVEDRSIVGDATSVRTGSQDPRRTFRRMNPSVEQHQLIHGSESRLCAGGASCRGQKHDWGRYQCAHRQASVGA